MSPHLHLDLSNGLLPINNFEIIPSIYHPSCLLHLLIFTICSFEAVIQFPLGTNFQAVFGTDANR